MTGEKLSLISLTDFPALARCSVVDSRLSSRGKIIKDLKACCLFEEIIEAKSLEHAKQLFLGDGVDLCILGPWVSAEACNDVIEFCNDSTSKDSPCAFVAVLNSDHKTEDNLFYAGVHGKLVQPYTKAAFAECLVNAVIKANRHGPWAKIARENAPPEEEKMVLRSGSEELPEKNYIIEENFELPVSIFPALREIVTGHEEGEYGLLIDGTPTKPALVALSKLTTDCIGDFSCPETYRETIQSILEKALVLWFQDMVLTTPERATAKFQQLMQSSMQAISKRSA